MIYYPDERYKKLKFDWGFLWAQRKQMVYIFFFSKQCSIYNKINWIKYIISKKYRQFINHWLLFRLNTAYGIELYRNHRKILEDFYTPEEWVNWDEKIKNRMIRGYS